MDAKTLKLIKARAQWEAALEAEASSANREKQKTIRYRKQELDALDLEIDKLSHNVYPKVQKTKDLLNTINTELAYTDKANYVTKTVKAKDSETVTLKHRTKNGRETTYTFTRKSQDRPDREKLPDISRVHFEASNNDLDYNVVL